MQSVILVDNSEIALSKEIFEKFATPCLKALLKKFYPELTSDENTFANKVLPDSYYTFKHRRVWGKIRRAGYFIQEAEEALRSLLHDEVHFYKDIYDLEQFSTENPYVETIQEEAQVNATESEQPLIAVADPVAKDGDKPKEAAKQPEPVP